MAKRQHHGIGAHNTAILKLQQSPRGLLIRTGWRHGLGDGNDAAYHPAQLGTRAAFQLGRRKQRFKIGAIQLPGHERLGLHLRV